MTCKARQHQVRYDYVCCVVYASRYSYEHPGLGNSVKLQTEIHIDGSTYKIGFPFHPTVTVKMNIFNVPYQSVLLTYFRCPFITSHAQSTYRHPSLSTVNWFQENRALSETALR
jgi:hypothetical protein